MIYLEIDIEEGCKAIAEVVMKLTIQQTMILKDAEREIMRITRVPSGWLYETWANLSKTKRNSTFVPYP